MQLGNGVIVSLGGEGKLCMNCHKSRRDAETYAVQYHDHFGPHHGPQADMLAGTNVVSFGVSIPSTTHNFAIANSCVTCHMALTPGSGTPPDSLDPAQYGRDEIGEHTFTMHWEGDGVHGPVDLVSGCVGCHGPKNSFDEWIAKMDYDEDGTVESAQDEVKGMMDNIGVLLPPLNDPAVVVDTNYTTLQLQSAYNYLSVEEDKSYGMHNLQFTVNLLKVTYDTLRGIPVSIFEEAEDMLAPDNYVLNQNYPNPFNPTTTISFGLPKRDDVRLVIYDILGKQIRTLFSGRINSGYHNYIWDGRDQQGNIVSAGVYIYRLQGNYVDLSRKMLFVK
ncbi:MAG: T9SS type A sorting domain-containing protein [Aliifodinibius sp.]|nr:T9SS type A sorting domain-containing protein [Fodinibius sp.]